VRYFLKRGEPPLTRVLLIESGSRSLMTRMPFLLNCHFGQDVEIDLVTCYPGLPEGFPDGTPAYRVYDYATPGKRGELVKTLLARNYSAAGMICSAEPIMTRWKWMLAARLPAKFFIINENGDYFWLHRDNWNTIKRFARARLGLTGEGTLRTVGRLVAFPFGLVYLMLYALFVHARRRLRLALR
jgi:hypothetical protein